MCCFPKLAEEPVLENGGLRVKPSWREKGGGEGASGRGCGRGGGTGQGGGVRQSLVFPSQCVHDMEDTSCAPV